MIISLRSNMLYFRRRRMRSNTIVLICSLILPIERLILSRCFHLTHAQACLVSLDVEMMFCFLTVDEWVILPLPALRFGSTLQNRFRLIGSSLHLLILSASCHYAPLPPSASRINIKEIFVFKRRELMIARYKLLAQTIWSKWIYCDA